MKVYQVCALCCAQLCPTLCSPIDCSQQVFSVKFFRQEYCRGLLFPSPGDLLTWESNPCLLHWQADSLLMSHQGSPKGTNEECTWSSTIIWKGIHQHINEGPYNVHFYSFILFSCSVMSNFLWPHGPQHTSLPCPSLSPTACTDSCPLSQWSLAVSSSVVLLSSCLQSFPASGSFLMSRLFISGGQSIESSASSSFQWIFRIDFL